MNLIRNLIISGIALSITIPTLGFDDFTFGNVEVPTNEIEEEPSYSQDIYIENNDYVLEPDEQIESSSDENLNNSTLQFIIDVTQKYPKQVDTGIRYTKKLSKDTVYDVINQIAVAKRSTIIEDSNSVVILVDGIIVEIPLKELTINELSNLFKKTNVFIDFRDSRKEQQFNLTEYLETYEKVNLIVNGTKIDFYNEPVIRNSRALLPVREIVEGLGAEIVSKYQNGKIYAEITKGNDIIKISEGSSTITINGKNIEIGVEAEVVVAKDGPRFFGALDEIIEILNGEIYWDAQLGSIVVSKK